MPKNFRLSDFKKCYNFFFAFKSNILEKIMKILILLILCLAPATMVAQQNDCAAVREKLSQAEKKLDDWAELNRYAAANAKVLPTQKGENRVVFMGDSITDIWDRNELGGFFPGKPYLNRGISGQTTPQMLIRFQPDVVANKPQVVVILAGTNDIAGNTGPATLEQIENNIRAMAEIATAHGIKVVLASVLPVNDYVRRPNADLYIQTKLRPPEKILAINDWLKNYAAKNGYTYLDYFDAMVDEKGFLKDGTTFDGLHPNAKGYAIMTPLAEAAIEKALKSKK